MLAGALAVDAHAHVISPFAKIPEGPGNKPETATLRTKEEYYDVLAGHGLTHGLLVQPSCYHFDNSVQLDAAEHAPRGGVKAIVNLDFAAGDDELDEMERRGAVGMRINLISLDPQYFERPESARLLRRLRERDWWLEYHVRAPDFPKYEPFIRTFEGKTIIDHVGRPEVVGGTNEPGFQRVLAFGREPNRMLKLSAPYRSSKSAAPWSDLDPFAAAAIEAFGIERCVWGSDWPFVNFATSVTYLQTLEWLFRIVPSESDRRAVLWHNPARSFGFA